MKTFSLQLRNRSASIVQAFSSPRVLALLFLGLSSGLPLALTGTALQAWYTVAGLKVTAIGALSLVGQPYVYKFLWAPLMDRFGLPWLDRRRDWILLTQVVLTVGLVVMAFMHPGTSPYGLAFVALLVAFVSASQDISINAYQTEVLHQEERGLGAGMMVTGYRMAMLVSGGLALVLADQIGWRWTYLIMAALMALEILITLFVPKIPHPEHRPLTLRVAVVEPFREFLSRRGAVAILVFIVLYKLGDAFALSLNTTFLLRGPHFTLTEIGSIYKLTAMITTLLGAVLGGALMVRLNLYRSLMYFGILQTASNLMFMWLAVAGKSLTLLMATIGIESFCGGLGTVAFVAFIMALCDYRYTATQYALLAALSAVGRVFIGPFAGLLAEHVSWLQFYFWSFVAGLPGLLVLLWLKRRLDFNSEKLA